MTVLEIFIDDEQADAIKKILREQPGVKSIEDVEAQTIEYISNDTTS